MCSTAFTRKSTLLGRSCHHTGLQAHGIGHQVHDVPSAGGTTCAWHEQRWAGLPLTVPLASQPLRPPLCLLSVLDPWRPCPSLCPAHPHSANSGPQYLLWMLAPPRGLHVPGPQHVCPAYSRRATSAGPGSWRPHHARGQGAQVQLRGWVNKASC